MRSSNVIHFLNFYLIYGDKNRATCSDEESIVLGLLRSWHFVSRIWSASQYGSWWHPQF
jgi:hypothetical protein